ncbi:unnamed protein product [Amoebophrya sp. A25]|nr:unnamed protein product [Amoebophrya sp. A25]|eukprot:GSA25T00004429001.1
MSRIMSTAHKMVQKKQRRRPSSQYRPFALLMVVASCSFGVEAAATFVNLRADPDEYLAYYIARKEEQEAEKRDQHPLQAVAKGSNAASSCPHGSSSSRSSSASDEMKKQAMDVVVEHDRQEAKSRGQKRKFGDIIRGKVAAQRALIKQAKKNLIWHFVTKIKEDIVEIAVRNPRHLTRKVSLPDVYFRTVECVINDNSKIMKELPPLAHEGRYRLCEVDPCNRSRLVTQNMDLCKSRIFAEYDAFDVKEITLALSKIFTHEGMGVRHIGADDIAEWEISWNF